MLIASLSDRRHKHRNTALRLEFRSNRSGVYLSTDRVSKFFFAQVNYMASDMFGDLDEASSYLQNRRRFENFGFV